MPLLGWPLWFVLVLWVRGFPRGAPLSACRTMAPSHGLAVNVAGPRVTLRARLLPDTRSATVTMSGRFRGFLVQARSKDDVRVLVPGRFTPTNGARTLDCDDRDDSAITHVDNTEKTNVTAKWAAPPGWEGSVVFKATVVKTYEAYPEYLFSNDISIRKAYETVEVVRHAPRPTVALSSPSAPLATNASSNKAAAISPMFNINEPSHKVTSSAWSKASSDDEWLTMATELLPNGSIQPLPVMAPTQTPCHAGVEVVNHLDGRVTRATARQSSDNDPYNGCGVTRGCFGLMGPCIQTRDCAVLLSYAVAPKGEGLDFQLTGGTAVKNNMWIAAGITSTPNMGKATVIDCFLYDDTPGMQESWNTDTMQNVVQTPTSAGITFGTHGVVDGLLRCAWNRKNVTVAQGKTFDIGKEKYYLLLASGSFLVDAATGKPTSQEKQMHTIRGLTATPLLLAQAYEVKQKEEDFLPYKIHGSLMLFAWLFLVSVAIMMARHFKKDWTGVKIADLHVWFVGVNWHPILGITASALAIAQPIMALFRCHANEPRRPLFNWLHWTNGNVAQSVALVAIYYAPGLTKSGLGESGAFLTVLTVLVGFHVAVHLGMQTLAMISTKPLDALILATVDEPKQDSPVPTLGASCGTSSAQAPQDGGAGKDEAKEDGAASDAEPASKEAAEDSEAPERKSEEEADGSSEAAVAGGAAGADPAATTPPHAPAQTDAVTASASQAQEPASSTLDTVRVVILVLYSLIMLCGVTALVWIVFNP
ncbi:putative ferric-chelate reductase 1 homolog isoform X2 [Rhipicephalus microplus]|uniref:putative ferric-chelate reductase 1 homolog isoform X2 n=1 Tax=Rhipicephalus microplus TaxID=6941 RepID=UPI003F6A8666